MLENHTGIRSSIRREDTRSHTCVRIVREGKRPRVRIIVRVLGHKIWLICVRHLKTIEIGPYLDEVCTSLFLE
jgi:hypothetical protein